MGKTIQRGPPRFYLGTSFIQRPMYFIYNTLSFIHKDLLNLKLVLEQESLILISWFDKKFMKANPDKFQAICIGKKTHDNIDYFQIGQTTIKCDDNATFLLTVLTVVDV